MLYVHAYLIFEDNYLDNQTLYTSDILSPADPADDSSDWILRRHVQNKSLIFTIVYDPPIVAQHVAVIRSDMLELGLLEVEVFGKFYSVKCIRK